MQLLMFTMLSLAVAATPAGAQTAVESFAALGSILSPGQEIRVSDEHGRTIRGTLVSIAGDELEMIAGRFHNPTTRTFVERTVIRVQRVDPLWNGRLIGGAIGLGAGLAWCYSIDAPENCSTAGVVVVLPLTAGGIALGNWIDWLHTPVVYQKAAQATRITVTPLIQRDRIGVFARVGL